MSKPEVREFLFIRSKTGKWQIIRESHSQSVYVGNYELTLKSGPDYVNMHFFDFVFIITVFCASV